MGKAIMVALVLALLAGCTYRRYEMPITVVNGRVPTMEEMDGATVVTVPPNGNNGNQLTLYLFIQADVPKHIQAEAEGELSLDSSLLPKP